MSQLRPILFNLNLFKSRFGFARPDVGKRFKSIEKAKDGPVKFTTSDAYVNYKATLNFAGDDRNLPKSHNLVIAGTSIIGFFYLIFLRDDVEADGGLELFKPVHETMPQFAIPMLHAAIAENRKLGYSTVKLEKKLAEYMKDPDKYGGGAQKFVEN